MTGPALAQIPLFTLVGKMCDYMDLQFEKHSSSLTHFHSDLLKSGKTKWTPPTEFRTCVRPLFQRHIDSVLKVLGLASESKVLELGAGSLSDGRSFLTSHLPAADYHYMDITQSVVPEAERAASASQYHQLDSTRIKTKFAPSSVDVVMASCFLDTLPQGDLKETIRQCSTVLKDGGTLFHIADLPPYFNTLVIDNREDNDIMFPLLEEDGFITGIQFVQRQKCKDSIKAWKKLGTEVEGGAFLQKFIDLSKDARGAVVVEIAQFTEKAIQLSKWVEERLSPTRRVNNASFYSDRLKKELDHAGFEISQFGLRTESMMQSRGESQFPSPTNDIAHLHGRKILKVVSRDADMVRITLGVHIVVAKKKPPTLAAQE